MNHLTVRLWNILAEQDKDMLEWMNSVNDNTNSAIKTLCDGVNDVIDNVNTINTTLANKVDKVTGKGLSTNDYTTAEKNKLQGIKDGATKTETSTTNGNIKIDGVEKTVYTHPTTHAASMITEDATRRFVTDTEKTKIGKSLTLDSIEAGANVTINKDATTNKMVINATGGGGSGSATWDTTTGKPFNTVDTVTLDTTSSTLKVKDNVFASKTHNHDGVYQPTGDYATNSNVDTKITTHNTNGVAHTDIRNAIPTKTSQLTNDSNFTSNSQVASLIETHNIGVDSHQDIRNAIPTKNSQLTNDSGYATTSQIPNVSNKLEAANIKAGTGVTVGINGNDVTINATGGSGGTSDYNDLISKPSVNGVTLTGDKTSDDLKLTEVVISSTQPTTPYKIWFESVASGSSTLDNSYALKTYVDTEDAKRIKYTDIVNDLTTGGANVPLSAEMGKQLFQSGVDFKTDVAGAITTKGVATSATDTKQTFVNNILAIPQTNNGGSITYLENTTEDFALGMLDGVKAENNSLVLNGAASGNRLSPKIFIPITNNKSSLINWDGNGSVGTICVDKGVNVGGGMDDNVVLMLHCEDFSDSSMSKKILSNNGCLISNNGRFDKCFEFNNSSRSYVSSAKSNDFDFKGVDGEFEFFIKLKSLPSTRYGVISNRQATGLGWYEISVENNGSIALISNHNNGIGGGISDMVNSSASLVVNKWYHVSIVKEGLKISIYIDGTNRASKTLQYDMSNNDSLLIGRDSWDEGDYDRFFDGYIDELRISKGMARHTSNFTPPTKPYSKIDTSLITPQTKNTPLQGLPINLTNKDIYLYESLTTGQSISNVSMNIKGDVEYTIHPNGAVTQSTYQQALSQNMILQNTLNKVVK